MKEEAQQALATIKQACGSVQANWETHLVIQNAVAYIESELGGTSTSSPAADLPPRKKPQSAATSVPSPTTK
jgi:hypothetical protein